MRLAGRLVFAYLVTTLALSSVSITYRWVVPIETPKRPWNRYHEVGLQDGSLIFDKFVPEYGEARQDGGRWNLDVHRPRFSLPPFYATVGPGGSFASVATWFFVACVMLILGVASVATWFLVA